MRTQHRCARTPAHPRRSSQLSSAQHAVAVAAAAHASCARKQPSCRAGSQSQSNPIKHGRAGGFQFIPTHTQARPHRPIHTHTHTHIHTRAHTQSHTRARAQLSALCSAGLGQAGPPSTSSTGRPPPAALKPISTTATPTASARRSRAAPAARGDARACPSRACGRSSGRCAPSPRPCRRVAAAALPPRTASRSALRRGVDAALTRARGCTAHSGDLRGGLRRLGRRPPRVHAARGRRARGAGAAVRRSICALTVLRRMVHELSYGCCS